MDVLDGVFRASQRFCDQDLSGDGSFSHGGSVLLHPHGSLSRLKGIQGDPPGSGSPEKKKWVGLIESRTERDVWVLYLRDS